MKKLFESLLQYAIDEFKYDNPKEPGTSGFIILIMMPYLIPKRFIRRLFGGK